MILEFGAKNFFSFKEGFEVLFQKSRTSKDNISNIIALKGANASGKTNVLKVLSFLQEFVTNSFSSIKPDEEIKVSSYFFNDEPIEIYIIFLENDIEYKYELALTKQKVLNEKIYRTKKREILIIERNNDKVSTIEEYKELEKINVNRTNASIVSIAKQYAIKEIDVIFNLFNFISNVNELGKLDNRDRFLDYNTVSKLYYENKKLLDFIIEFLKNADSGIADIKIERRKDPQSGNTVYFPLFYYDVAKKKQFLTYFEQSSGIQTLYLQLHLYLTVLSMGGVLVMDEFDINLHPDLLPMLLDFFDDEMLNTNQAQLILTTHTYNIMDRLGKYKTILVNKEENESYLYRLDEIPGDILRNDRPISPIYNANKIGGKPRIKFKHG